MLEKNWVLMLIRGANEAGYIELRNDLIEDIKHLLTDDELNEVLGMIESASL